MCFHLPPTPLHHLAIWLVESSAAMIWRHHRPELVEFVDPGMMFEEGCDTVCQLLDHTKTHGRQDTVYDNRSWGDAFHIPEDAIRCANHSIIQIVSCIPSCLLISWSREYDLLEV